LRDNFQSVFSVHFDWSINIHTAVANLYRRLSDVGIDRPYLKRFVLPEWWDDTVAISDAGQADLCMRIARSLNLNFRDLLNPERKIEVTSGNCLFKHAKNADAEEFRTAVSICLEAARLALLGTPDYREVQDISGNQVRDEILAVGADWPGLRELANWCWRSGVPVLHVPNFPTKAKKPDGLLLRIDGRYAIVVCKKSRFQAWLLFILAHEMGHLIRGHLNSDTIIVDAKIGQDADASKDIQEAEASSSAIEILTGQADLRYRSATVMRSPLALASAAVRVGKKHSVEPGHIILNYSHSQGASYFRFGNAALKIAENGQKSGTAVLQNALVEHLEWDRLPEESAAFLSRITSADTTNTR